MTTSDDPPFLNVGTEVSAKYRGAFCEATIKIAKKVVKCKVCYTKGHMDTLPNDLIKGPLKVGATVDIRQPDGQYMSAVIQKLTDASTYTVVFDDGDERTLRRSSLCLKGGRHYSASESLDQMPLTDPENFGTPAHFQSKRGTRRRRRLSQSSSPEAESNSPIKTITCSYPPEYPVGKCVFLENDRRRAGWVPGVIVPAHFVMDDSETTDDIICIRSFKDGRFFAAKTSELHDFAPDKEPLSSMLVGEIQPMYMCKPAIERAMAYLDTKELPWDMDLFGVKNSLSTSNDNEDKQDQSDNNKITEEQKKDIDDFYNRLAKFQEERGAVVKKPSLASRDLDLYKLYNLVKENGGMEKVTQELKWRSLYLQMGMPQFSNSSYLIKQAYKRYLYGFEVFEKALLDGKPLPIKNKRRSTVHESDEEPIKFIKDSELKKSPKSTVNGNTEPSPNLTVGKETSGDETLTLSSTGTTEYCIGERINVLYGRGKTLQTYEAKIIDRERINDNKMIYYVHYNGWNTRYDEWISADRIAGKATGLGGRHCGRASYSRKKHGRLKSQQSRLSNGMIEFNANSPSSISEPLSYSSGSENGVSSTKGTVISPNGDSQRRRISSTTETGSSVCTSDTPQSPDSSKHLPVTPPNQPLTKHYPHSPPLMSSQTVTYAHTTHRVPPILSPDGSVSLITPPQESALIGNNENNVLIKKEENLEYIHNPVDDNISTSDGSPAEVSSIKDDKSLLEFEETTMVTSPSSGSLPAEDLVGVVNTNNNADNEERTILDEVPFPSTSSLINNNSSRATLPCLTPPTVTSSSLFSICTPVGVSTDLPRPLSPPVSQSDIGSGSCTESEHEMSLLLDTKLSSISPSICDDHHDNQEEGRVVVSPRKRKTGHDSGVENGSESDNPEVKISCEDITDFSIDMTNLNGLNTTERIGMILERMKEIQKRYMELKAEVTYLDRKRRRARRKERETTRLHNNNSPAHASFVTTSPYPPTSSPSSLDSPPTPNYQQLSRPSHETTTQLITDSTIANILQTNS